MNKTLKAACFDEITHLICDADKKVLTVHYIIPSWNLFILRKWSYIFIQVNISDVSNNWNISHRDSEAILLEWIETHKKQQLNKEFLIRGVDKSGNCVITVSEILCTNVAVKMQ